MPAIKVHLTIAKSIAAGGKENEQDFSHALIGSASNQEEMRKIEQMIDAGDSHIFRHTASRAIFKSLNLDIIQISNFLQIWDGDSTVTASRGPFTAGEIIGEIIVPVGHYMHENEVPTFHLHGNLTFRSNEIIQRWRKTILRGAFFLNVFSQKRKNHEPYSPRSPWPVRVQSRHRHQQAQSRSCHQPCA